MVFSQNYLCECFSLFLITVTKTCCNGIYHFKNFKEEMITNTCSPELHKDCFLLLPRPVPSTNLAPRRTTLFSSPHASAPETSSTCCTRNVFHCEKCLMFVHQQVDQTMTSMSIHKLPSLQHFWQLLLRLKHHTESLTDRLTKSSIFIVTSQ